MAWPGVQPSPLGGGEASAAQEPQQDQEDNILEASKPIPREPFIFENDPVIVQEDVAIPKPSPQPKPEPSASVLDLPLSQDPSSAPTRDLNEYAQDH